MTPSVGDWVLGPPPPDSAALTGSDLWADDPVTARRLWDLGYRPVHDTPGETWAKTVPHDPA